MLRLPYTTLHIVQGIQTLQSARKSDKGSASGTGSDTVGRQRGRVSNAGVNSIPSLWASAAVFPSLPQAPASLPSSSAAFLPYHRRQIKGSATRRWRYSAAAAAALCVGQAFKRWHQIAIWTLAWPGLAWSDLAWLGSRLSSFEAIVAFLLTC